MSKTKVKNFLGLVKFGHSIFAMPFAAIGASLALTKTHLQVHYSSLLCIVLCMIFARNTAMAFNRYLDRRIDKLNARTANREIPAGVVSPKEALLFTIINAVLFLATTYFINRVCFCLSPLALGTILAYSYTKRFTALCHVVLGLGLAYAPVGAYLCLAPQFDFSVVILSLGVLFWVSGFDIIYSLQDASFDKKQHLKSIPVRFGTEGALHIAAFLHALSGLMIIYFGVREAASATYWLGALLFLALLMYQHGMVRRGNKMQGSAALSINGLASFIYAVFCIIDLNS